MQALQSLVILRPTKHVWQLSDLKRLVIEVFFTASERRKRRHAKVNDNAVLAELRDSCARNFRRAADSTPVSDECGSSASAVSTYLATEGVPSERITSIGYGETRPKASNDTPEGRQLNRRVEIHIRATQGYEERWRPRRLVRRRLGAAHQDTNHSLITSAARTPPSQPARRQRSGAHFVRERSRAKTSSAGTDSMVPALYSANRRSASSAQSRSNSSSGRSSSRLLSSFWLIMNRF
jgi:hypothetical protein